MLHANALHRIVDVIDEVGHRHLGLLFAGLEEGRHGGDLYDAADILQRVELLVIHVAGVVAQSLDAGMGGEHRSA